MLDNRYALLFIRGERPIMDMKYDILKHPNVAGTADGKAGIYTHGEVKDAVATIEYIDVGIADTETEKDIQGNFELLSEEDLEKIFEEK